MTTARDGESAWRALRRDGTIEIAILNWLMPGLDGWRIARRLQAEKLGRVYTILLVGRHFRDEVLRALASGPDDCLAKPFDVRDMRLRLRAAVLAVRFRRFSGPPAIRRKQAVRGSREGPGAANIGLLVAARLHAGRN